MCACHSIGPSLLPEERRGERVLPPILSGAPQALFWGCCDSWGSSCPGLRNCPLSLSQTQMSPAMNGPSTCCPWMKTSSAWSCPSSSVTTFWSVGHCRGGDSPSYPLYLTGAGDKVLFGEEVCEVLLSPSAHTAGLVCSPGAVSVGEWRLAPELAPLLLAEQLRGIPLCSS